MIFLQRESAILPDITGCSKQRQRVGSNQAACNLGVGIREFSLSLLWLGKSNRRIITNSDMYGHFSNEEIKR
jgi:hypothetical protein